MASEILKVDANNKPVVGFVTDDANQFVKMGRIDDATKGLKVMIVGGTGSGTVTSVSVATANGFSGTVATASTTPVITLATTATSGSVLFAGTAGQLQQDNANLFFDDTSNQLRVGLTGAPFNADSRVRLAVVGNVNDYSDIGIQNKNAGDSATGDIFVSADNDNSTLIGHYVDMGITGSGWNPTTAGNIKTVSVNTAGSGYSVNDVLTVSTGGDGNGQVTVATIGGGGSVTSVTLSNNGTGYVIGSGYSTTGGGGSGCKINVLSIINFTLWGANDGYMFTSGGNQIIHTDTLGTTIKFAVEGAGTANEVGRFTTTGLTVGLAGTTLGKLTFSGNTSGTTVLQGLAVASGTLTLPSATDTVAVLAASQAFTNKTYNGLTVTSSTGTLTVTNGKTLAVSNTLTLAGTDSTTMTFPATSATIARTDAANTFTGIQTVSTLTAPTNASISVTAGTFNTIQTYSPAGGATATLDLSKGNIHHITMPAGNITIALSNGTAGQCFIIRILQDSVGSRTVTWFTTIKWAGGSAPTLTTTASKADTVGFEITGSSTYDGFVVGQNI